ncbi:septation protein IspZ [Moraxella caviae]|uniref:Inner membrane-spanning protein YciB n=1 Tax=Moraxella caviae TaxID=34060 RepID=A0A1T0A0P9_9GAMM|nr:septation protein IspZ [Moraxella caviae]OOR88771.1 septation protein IspZ [Moraxella caviae]STZ14863.1 Probable intracellular septation protein A [Moraxella caviae]VEW13650.1 Probable intracellular septation protein A [Moraxella caviae]
MKSLLDFVPLIVFYYLYKTVSPTDTDHPLLRLIGTAGVDNNHILVATAGLIGSMIIVYGAMFVQQKFRLEKQQWFILLMTVVFGGVTLLLSDDYYIRLKAILINAGFAIALLASPLFFKDRQPAVQKLFGSVFLLSKAGWQRLNLAWAGLFALMAALHGFFAFVFMDGKYWGDFTAFGDMIVMFVFIITMLFVLRKHLNLKEQ